MAAVLYSLRGGRGFDLKSNIKVTWRKGALLAHIDLSRCGQRPSRANRDIGALAVWSTGDPSSSDFGAQK